MEWLNIPFILIAYAIGAYIGSFSGFLIGYGMESLRSYNRGFKAGYEQIIKERDTK